VSDSELIDLPDAGFKAMRYGVEEVCHFLNAKMSDSNNAFQKYKDAKQELVSWSERDIAGNELKGVNTTLPFAARLPEIIPGSIIF